ncbi:efflux RND transporter permease subunit [Pseudomonas aeruginosa]|nr:efflux RND transporter permease subunit [Pseudomonas aeruginosa]
MVGGALGAILLTALVASRMGSEFIPSLARATFAMQGLRAGHSLTQSVEMQQTLEKKLMGKFPEIERVFARTGTAEIASDLMPPNASDSYVMLKPQSQWPDPKKSRRRCWKNCRPRPLRCRAASTSSPSRSSCASTN